ncbi:hypothetical protein [Dickeya zeae]|uniref:Uncharacterized protein n=2 Tax=Dickeya zeae TaxID=204042 RepID=A0ABX8VVS2_9GAMM|nr:hypothetical protein [Dickeya zeae]QYM92019.1 hypothetical protein FGI21_09100 [Dickeya zeae]
MHIETFRSYSAKNTAFDTSRVKNLKQEKTMPSLTYYVPATGCYGVKAPNELNIGETFGSQGATVCVILLLTKNDGNLFCGHMACGISGAPGNKDTVETKAQLLLDNALGDTNKAQPWTMTSSSKDMTTTWMREAITRWFTNAPTQVSNENTDGYFINNQGAITSLLSNNMDENNAQEVNTGSFLIE